MLRHPILRPLTLVSSSWFVVFQGWSALQTLYATRELGLSAGELGAAAHDRRRRRAARGARRAPSDAATSAPACRSSSASRCSAIAWLVVALVPQTDHALASARRRAFLFDFGTTLYWINYASLRQAVTPDGMLGRMTATMRFFTVAAGAARRDRGRARGRGVRRARDVRRDGARSSSGWWRSCTSRTGLRHVPDVSTLIRPTSAVPTMRR